MSDYKAILYDVMGNWARIKFNRPEVRNAINHDLEVDVKHAILRANADKAVKAIVLTGAGTAFSSGIDLKLHRGRSVAEARKHFESFYWGFHTTIRSVDKPVIAVVNGPAREAGCTMAFMCDMIIASDTASFGLPAVDRGIVPAYHLVHLPRIVGRLKAFEICFSGEPITATEAAQLQIINKVIPAAQLEAETVRYIERFANKPAMMMKIGRELMYRTMDMEFEKGIRTAADIVALLAGFQESHEGFGAFVEKREANWQG